MANIGGENVILANHTDGNIWAFNIDSIGSKGTGIFHVSLRPGFPLLSQGTLTQACAISDLQGNGMLDLVAADDAGYIYDWTLGPGSIYNQPWPMPYGNNWNTAYTGYKDGGVVGFLHDDWSVARIYPNSPAAPYSWLESGAGNGGDTVSRGQAFSTAGGITTASSSGDQNLTYVGLNTSNWKNYTVTGSIKFDNANAQFGFDVYSSMPDSCRKYSIIRDPDGTISWRYYTGPQTFVALDTSADTLAPSPNTWYNFKIQVKNSDHWIQAECWKQGDPDPTLNPDYVWSIQDINAKLSGGRIGLVSSSGTGNVYWGPITVVTSDPSAAGTMAYESFKADSFVDVKPYTPVDWHPDYSSIRLDAGFDTTGFVLDKTDTAIIYQPKAGVTYPLSCSIIPYTSLPWQDYTFSGMIVKPAGAVYDSIGVGVDVYSSNGNQYRVTFNTTTMTVSGGYFNKTVALPAPFNNNDSLKFNVAVSTDTAYLNSDTIPDGSVSLTVNVFNNQTQEFTVAFQGTDQTNSRIMSGVPSVFIDLTGHESNAISAIRFKNAIVQKTGM